jgi:hypothetical protein
MANNIAPPYLYTNQAVDYDMLRYVKLYTINRVGVQIKRLPGRHAKYTKPKYSPAEVDKTGDVVINPTYRRCYPTATTICTIRLRQARGLPTLKLRRDEAYGNDSKNKILRYAQNDIMKGLPPEF